MTSRKYGLTFFESEKIFDIETLDFSQSNNETSFSHCIIFPYKLNSLFAAQHLLELSLIFQSQGGTGSQQPTSSQPSTAVQQQQQQAPSTAVQQQQQAPVTAVQQQQAPPSAVQQQQIAPPAAAGQPQQPQSSGQQQQGMKRNLDILPGLT